MKHLLIKVKLQTWRSKKGTDCASLNPRQHQAVEAVEAVEALKAVNVVVASKAFNASKALKNQYQKELSGFFLALNWLPRYL